MFLSKPTAPGRSSGSGSVDYFLAKKIVYKLSINEGRAAAVRVPPERERIAFGEL